MELNNYKISIDTISPVCISDTKDKVLSPYTDFVVRKGRINYIDHSKMDSFFTGDPGLVKIYTNRIKSLYRGNRSEFSLVDFIENDLGASIESLTRISLDYKGERYNSKNNIICVVRNAGEPYLPGSSIKGAIKGALLYHWLSETPGGRNALTHIFNAIENNLDSRKLELAISNVISPLFGSTKDMSANEYNKFRVADSSLFSENDLAVYHVERLHMKKGITQIPVDLEAIDTGKRCNTSISLGGNFSGERGWLNNLEFHQLYNIINSFSRQNIEHDWQDLDDHVHDIENGSLYDNIFNFYENMSEEMDKPGNNVIYLRLGTGKGFLHQTIGLAIKKKDPSSYNKYYKQLRLGRRSNDQFPATRLFALPQGLPLGWIKIKALQ